MNTKELTAIEFIKEILERNEILKSGKILELACGDGKNIKQLSVLGYSNIDGVEASEELARKAKELNSDSNIIVSEIEKFSVKSPTYEAVYCVSCFRKLNDPEEVCKNVAMMLKPGGLFMFDFLNKTAFKKDGEFDIWQINRMLSPWFNLVSTYSGYTSKSVNWEKDKFVSVIASWR